MYPRTTEGKASRPGVARSARSDVAECPESRRCEAAIPSALGHPQVPLVPSTLPLSDTSTAVDGSLASGGLRLAPEHAMVHGRCNVNEKSAPGDGLSWMGAICKSLHSYPRLGPMIELGYCTRYWKVRGATSCIPCARSSCSIASKPTKGFTAISWFRTWASLVQSGVLT